MRGTANRDRIASMILWSGAGLAVLLIAVCWWFWPTRVALNETGYDVAIALYSICNQRSDTDVAKIENELTKLRLGGHMDEKSITAMEDIVERAKDGDWSGAMKDCREILEQQVKR